MPQHPQAGCHSRQISRQRTPGRGATLKGMFLADIFGPQGLIVLVLILVLLFGANQLPKLARSVGEASKEFKRSQQEAEEEAQAKAPAPAVAV